MLGCKAVMKAVENLFMKFNTETDFKQNDTFMHKFLSKFFTLIIFPQSKQILENLIFFF